MADAISDASTRKPGALPLVGLIASAASFVIAPGLVTVGFYMPVFSMMNPAPGAFSHPASADTFPSFGAWAVVPLLLPLPGVVLSLVALLRRNTSGGQKGMAIAGVTMGVLAMVFVGAYSLYLYR